MDTGYRTGIDPGATSDDAEDAFGRHDPYEGLQLVHGKRDGGR